MDFFSRRKAFTPRSTQQWVWFLVMQIGRNSWAKNKTKNKLNAINKILTSRTFLAPFPAAKISNGVGASVLCGISWVKQEYDQALRLNFECVIISCPPPPTAEFICTTRLREKTDNEGNVYRKRRNNSHKHLFFLVLFCADKKKYLLVIWISLYIYQCFPTYWNFHPFEIIPFLIRIFPLLTSSSHPFNVQNL